jgi:hypothetical protein
MKEEALYGIPRCFMERIKNKLSKRSYLLRVIIRGLKLLIPRSLDQSQLAGIRGTQVKFIKNIGKKISQQKLLKLAIMLTGNEIIPRFVTGDEARARNH